MATRYDIAIDAGSTYAMQIQLEDDDGLPLSMVGCSAQSMIRYNYKDVSPAAIFTPLIDSVNGVLTLSLTPAQTASLTRAKGIFDVELTFSDGTTQRLVEGQVIINPEVTK